VGSKGIKPRKKRRPLPKVSRKAGSADDSPPVMWSPPGSGFEASGFSPAGRALQFWAFVRGSTAGGHRRRVATRLLLVIVLLLVVVPFVIGALAALTS
jgi:hypothetical protein